MTEHLEIVGTFLWAFSGLLLLLLSIEFYLLNRPKYEPFLGEIWLTNLRLRSGLVLLLFVTRSSLSQSWIVEGKGLWGI